MKTHSLLNFLTFTCFLVVGYLYSTRFYPHETGTLFENPHLVSAEDRSSVGTLLNGQRSFLIIITSAINSPSANLESIWLASYVPTDTTLRMMPIFPTSKHTASSFETQLTQSFHLTKQVGSFVPDQSFFDVLADNNYWWSGYFVLDEYALNKISEILAKNETDDPTVAAGIKVGEVLGYLASPQNRYSSDLRTLQTACQKFLATHRDIEISLFLSSLSTHILSDLAPEQIITEWAAFASTGRSPSCKFPALEVSRLEQ